MTARYRVERAEDRPRGRCRRWRLWVRADGKRRSKRFSGTYREAQAALREFVEEVSTPESSRCGFGEYAMSLIGYARTQGLADSTLRTRQDLVKALMLEFGGCALADMDARRIRSGLTAIRDGNNASGRRLSGSYSRKLHGALHSVIRQAHVDGLIPSDVMEDMPAPRVDTSEKGWMEPSELHALSCRVRALPQSGYRIMILMIIAMGLRRGEACGLRWEDVGGGVMRVCAHGRGKTAAARRDLPMPRWLEDEIGAWRDASGRSDGAVALSSSGAPMTTFALASWWSVNRESLGAGQYSLHQIRHSNLSMMARHMSVFDLQRWAGWSSIDMAKTYVHADYSSMSMGAADAFEHHFVTA